MAKIILIFILFTAGCKEKKRETASPGSPVSKTSIFPVTQYLLGQLNELDSLPVTALKITRLHGITDSVWMQKKDLRPFLLPFVNTVIDSASLHEFFSGRSFLDQTINAITLSYDPTSFLPDSLRVRRWDVYIDPDNNTVTRVYIVKQLRSGSSLQTIQLTWKSGHYCQITTISEKEGSAPDIKEERLIWNFNN